MTQMNQEIKAKWVAALKSGKYPQGAFKLNSRGSYCCLGVLCEIAKEAGIVDSRLNITNVTEYFSTTDVYQGDDTILPRVVADWAGLETCSPDVDVTASITAARRPLTTVNDRGVPFTEIAEMIDRSL